MSTRHSSFLTAVSLAALCAGAAVAAPTPRPTPVAGAIVATKGGEELRFAREGDWRAAELQQELVGGDAVRTNAIGNLAILFADQTQIRVGRNSTLVVDAVAGARAAATQLELQGGQVWARAARGGSGVDVKTPAATAAIRGTDWSLSVEGSKTSLIVLEGVVELKNPQGSVTVRQGEGAVATIGQKPTKFIITNSEDREQMLFYVALRDAFVGIEPTPFQGPQIRAERDRLKAIPPERRRAEDWLGFAEVGLTYEGREPARAALAQARRLGLSGSQKARADLVDAIIAGRERRWSESAALFARAERGGLDGGRRVAAAYGRYLAASLADPKRILPEPTVTGDGPSIAVAKAFIAGFKQDTKTAADMLKAAEKQYPKDLYIALGSAKLALQLNRREDMRAAMARARALDPGNPDVLTLDASIKAFIDGDIDGALKDLRRAVEIAPGQSGSWVMLGLVESARDHALAAEAAFRRAIAEDPDGSLGYANLALLLLDQSRVPEAQALIDKSVEVDPNFYAAYAHRGRLLLQSSEGRRALQSILSGTVANPGVAQDLLLAAAAYYQNGEIELSEQALDNAERLDRNDPVVPLARTVYALDQYKADEAIANAREALRRYRARGGYFSALAVNQRGGSYTSAAYRFLSLDEWGRYYGDRVFDSFTASSYFDQAASRRPRIVVEKPIILGGDGDLTSFSLNIQGLLYDPLAVGGPLGRLDIFRRPFFDVEAGGSVISQAGRLSYQSDLIANGFSNLPIPVSFSLSATGFTGNERNVAFQERGRGASLFIGAAPTAADRLLVFGMHSQVRPGIIADAPAAQSSTLVNNTQTQAGAAWSHSFADRNVVSGGVFYSAGTGRQNLFALQNGSIPGADPAMFGYPDPGRYVVDYEGTQQDATRIRTYSQGTIAALNHTFGFDDVTLAYGVEGQFGHTRYSEDSTSTLSLLDVSTPFPFSGAFDVNALTGLAGVNKSPFRAGRAYADGRWRPSDRFEIQASAQYAFYEADSRVSILNRAAFDFYSPLIGAAGPSGPTSGSSTSTSSSVEDRDQRRVDPRIGVAFSPVEGQWLRAAYRQDTTLPLGLTLSPLSTVGLIPNTLLTSAGGHTDTLALRWDAEWHPRFFTSVEYQRQDVRGPRYGGLDQIGLELPISGTLDTLGLTRARIDRVQASANLWLGYGIGLFGSVGAAEAENLTRNEVYGRQIPFVAERFARFGLTYAHPSRLKFTLASTFAGGRTGDLAGTKLDDYWSTDAAITWETPDRHLVMGLTVINLFDTRYELAPNIPGPGRTVAATLKARF